MERERVSRPHKCIRTPGSILCPKVLSPDPNQQSHLPETRQYHSSLVPKQLGGHSLPATSPSSNSDLGLVRKETPISSGTAYPRQNQCGSGYRVPGETGSERLEDTTENHSTPYKRLHDRSLCLPLTHQLKRYVSWRPDPSAVYNDAFTMDWSNLKAYAFSPFNLIPSVLQKAKKEHATLVLVAPLWTTQPWWPLLIELIVDYPVYLGNNPKLLQDVSSPGAMHPLFPSLKLAVWRISGNVTKQWEFQKKLSNSSATTPRAQPPKHKMFPGLSGVAGVRRGKVIPYHVQCLTF